MMEISSYLPTQKEFKNLLFCHSRSKDTLDMGNYLHHIEVIIHDRSFFTNFVSVCSEER